MDTNADAHEFVADMLTGELSQRLYLISDLLEAERQDPEVDAIIAQTVNLCCSLAQYLKIGTFDRECTNDFKNEDQLTEMIFRLAESQGDLCGLEGSLKNLARWWSDARLRAIETGERSLKPTCPKSGRVSRQEDAKPAHHERVSRANSTRASGPPLSDEFARFDNALARFRDDIGRILDELGVDYDDVRDLVRAKTDSVCLAQKLAGLRDAAAEAAATLWPGEAPEDHKLDRENSA